MQLAETSRAKYYKKMTKVIEAAERNNYQSMRVGKKSFILSETLRDFRRSRMLRMTSS